MDDRASIPGPCRSLPARTIRPACDGCHPRERLFARLDSARAAWIAAPAGAGKTTLVSSYVESRSLDCLWYRVEPGDRDVASVFHYLGRAVRAAGGGDLPVPGPEHARGIPAFTRRWFEALFAAVPGFVLVFDDCHAPGPGSAFDDLLRAALETMPPACRLIMAGRAGPPPAMSRALANRDLDLVGWDDLRLDDREAAAIIAGRGLDPEGEEAVRVRTAAGGWAAGLTLLLGGSRPAGDMAGADPVMFSYFAEEIMKGMEPRDQDFLMRTAFLGEMDSGSAARVGGRRDAEALVARLRAGNCFIEGRPGAWRYHPLFAAFLLERARRTYPPERLAAIRLQAARELEAGGKPEPAAELHVEAGDWRALAAMVTAHAGTMTAQGRHRTVAGWIRALPREMVASSPVLLCWSGTCSLAADPAASLAEFERAFDLFTAAGDREGTLSAWSGAVETYLHSLTGLERLDPWISFLDHLDGGPFLDPAAAPDQVAARMFAALAVRRPTHPRMPEWKKRALEVMENGKDPSLRMLTGFYLHTHLIWSGLLPEAGYLLERLREIAAAAPAWSLAAVTMKVAGSWAWLYGSCAEAGATMREGLAVAAASGVRLWDYLLMVQGAAAALSSPDTDAAGELLAAMAGIEDNGRALDRFYFHYQSSWRFHLLGDFPRAMMHQERALDLADSTGLHYARAQGRLAMAHLRHEEGDPDRAAGLLEDAAGIGADMGSLEIEFVAGLLRAGFALDDGREEEGIAALAAALALPPPHASGWDWPVKIEVLGRFRVLVNGGELDFRGRKAPRKPLLLLRVLVALGGGEDVDEERLQDILWPDADGDAARKSLEVTIARLRKLLGRREAIVCRHGRVGLDRRCCYLDALAFTTLAGQEDAAGRGGRLRQAVELYQGHFLADETAAWVISRREDLRDQFVRLVGELARLLVEEGRHREAAEVYRKGLRADDLVEEFHQGLIACHAAAGRRDRALAAYDRCCSILAARGLEPSPRTVRARDRALRS